MTGIYQITCLPTGKRYIGSTVDFGQRWRHHRNDLKAGRHCNPKLQAAWNKYGADNFTFEALELIIWSAPSKLKAAEERWLAEAKPEFNINPRADAPMRFATEAQRAHMRAVKTGTRHTPETRAKMSLAQSGRIHSEETKAKLSIAHQGRAKSAEHLANISNANKGRQSPFKGRSHSEESKARIRATKAANPRPAYKHTPEVRAKIAKARLGIVFTAEHRAKISAVVKAAHAHRRAEKWA